MNRSNTKGGWKSRVVWLVIATLVVCFTGFIFCVMLANKAMDTAKELALQDAEVPEVYERLIDALPFSTIFTVLAWVVPVAVAGYRGRDIARNIMEGRKNGSPGE